MSELHPNDQIDLSWLSLPEGHPFQDIIGNWHDVRLTKQWVIFSTPRKNFIAATQLSRKHPDVALFHYLKAIAAEDYLSDSDTANNSKIITYDVVVREFEMAITLSPKNFIFQQSYTHFLFERGDCIKALPFYRKLFQLERWEGEWISEYFTTLIYLDLKDEVSAIITKLRDLGETGYMHWLRVWLLYQERNWQGLVSYYELHKEQLEPLFQEFIISPYLWAGYSQQGRLKEALAIQYHDPYATMHDDQNRSLMLLYAKEYRPLLDEVTEEGLSYSDRYYPHFYVPRAEALRLHGRFKEALLLIEMFTGECSYSFAFAIKSAILWQLGLKEEALLALNQFKDEQVRPELVTYLSSIYQGTPVPQLDLPQGIEVGPLESTMILWASLETPNFIGVKKA